jgi:hypothetical protein
MPNHRLIVAWVFFHDINRILQRWHILPSVGRLVVRPFTMSRKGPLSSTNAAPGEAQAEGRRQPEPVSVEFDDLAFAQGDAAVHPGRKIEIVGGNESRQP